jgi:hypothetical protein
MRFFGENAVREHVLKRETGRLRESFPFVKPADSKANPLSRFWQRPLTLSSIIRLLISHGLTRKVPPDWLRVF